MLGTVVYDAILDALRIDKRGGVFTVDVFNRLSPIVNHRMMADYCKKFEDGIDSTHEIGRFKELDQPVALTNGVASLPSNYYRIIGEPWCLDSDGEVRYFDIVTSLPHSKRERDYLTRSTAEYPTCLIGSDDSIGNMEIRVYPKTITAIYMDYLREPRVPFLDYYVKDDTLETTFLSQGQPPITISAGYTYRTGGTGTITSVTVDWEFTMDELPMIIAYFREELGSVIPDPDMIQVGVKDKMEMQ